MSAADQSACGPCERSDGFSAERKRYFLVALRNGESVLAACALVGVSNRTAYNHRARDPAFARDWDLARQAWTLPLELAAYERGVIGIEEPVYVYGKQACTRTRYSDSLLRTLLAGEKPGKYGRRAGLKADRKWLGKKIDARVAVEVAPLRAAVEQAEAELAALRMLRDSTAGRMNVVNPDDAGRAASTQGKRRGSWRLAAARRRDRTLGSRNFSRSP